jgi:predicted DNA-binding transcriptional regulator AlpA
MRRVIETPDRDLLTARQCAAWLNVSLSQFRQLVRDGHFPAPIHLAPKKCSRWLWSDAVAYVWVQAAGRRTADPTGETAGRRREIIRLDDHKSYAWTTTNTVLLRVALRQASRRLPCPC